MHNVDHNHTILAYITLCNISENCITLTMCLLFLKKTNYACPGPRNFHYYLITLTSYHRVIKKYIFPRIFSTHRKYYYYVITLTSLYSKYV